MFQLFEISQKKTQTIQTGLRMGIIGKKVKNVGPNKQHVNSVFVVYV